MIGLVAIYAWINIAFTWAGGQTPWPLATDSVLCASGSKRCSNMMGI